jgi:hypothetical protein
MRKKAEMTTPPVARTHAGNKIAEPTNVATHQAEVRDYYLRISVEEISSHLGAFTFDLWESVENYRKRTGAGARWLDIGGGVGEVAAISLEKGYDVHMTEVFDELLRSAERRHPQLRGRLSSLDIFDSYAVRQFVEREGTYDIVTSLGAVLNHARTRAICDRGFANLIRLAGSTGILVVDIMLSEMFPKSPSSVWSDFTHFLLSFKDVARLVRRYDLQVMEAHSINYVYPPSKASEEAFDERMMRFYLRRAA